MPSLFFILFSAVFLIPFGVALSYFIIGINLRMKGKREDNLIKIRSGNISLLNSLVSMIIIFIVWRWLADVFFEWNW